MIEKIEEYLDKEKKERTREHGRYHVTDLTCCQRQAYYKYVHPKPLGLKTVKNFKIGGLLHQYIQSLPIFENYLKEVRGKVVLSDGIVILGHADMVNKSEIVELKSTGWIDYVHDKPQDPHKKQLQMYIHILGKQKGKIIYFNKKDFDMVEHEVHRDDQEVEKLISKAKELHECITRKNLPGREEGWECKFCDWKEECMEVE